MRPTPYTLGPRAAGLSLAAMLWVGAASSAQAQDPTPPVFVDPKPEQFEWDTKGVEAFLAKDFDKAVEYYRKTLQLGDLNSTYLNLGIVLFAQGRCEEAVLAYDRAEVAPKVRDPKPEDVARILREQRAKLLNKCARVVFECKADNLWVALGDTPPLACQSKKPIWLTPGEYPLKVRSDQGSSETVLTLQATESRIVAIEPPAPKPDEEPPPTVEPSFWHAPETWSLTLWGTGLAAWGVLGVMELAWFQPTWDEYRAASEQGDASRFEQLRGQIDEQKVFGWSLFGAGLGLVTAGTLTYFFVEGGEAPSEPSTGGPALQAWGSPEGGGLLWRGAW